MARDVTIGDRVTFLNHNLRWHGTISETTRETVTVNYEHGYLIRHRGAVFHEHDYNGFAAFCDIEAIRLTHYAAQARELQAKEARRDPDRGGETFPAPRHYD